MLLLSASLALAEPDRVAWSSEVGTALSALTVSDDLPVAAFVDEGSDSLVVLDTETWETAFAQPCSGASATAIDALTDEETVIVWLGCEDGSVVPVSYAAGELSVGEGVTVTGSSGGDSGGEDGGGRAILGLAFDGDGFLWIVADGEDDGYPEVHLYDPLTAELDPDWTAATTSVDGVEDVALLAGVLLVVHGSDDVSRVDLSSGSVARSSENLSGRDFVDIWTDGSSVGLLADANGSLVEYLSASSEEYAILLDDEDGLESVTAVTVDEDAGWAALADADAGYVYLHTYAGGGSVGDERLQALPVEGAVGLGVYGDYLVAVADQGKLSVLTELPWVELDASPSGALTAGELVTLSIAADVEGDYEVLLDGDTLAEGELEAAGTASVELTVSADWAEGANRVYVEVADGERVGLGAVDLDVDNPPSQVDLSADDVGFGHEKVILDFAGVEDEDLSIYRIYVTTVAWQREDYDSGGPDYEGPDEDPPGPLDVAAEPGEDVYVVIEGLQNTTSYYLGVRAVDEGGQEGPMSRVIEAQPQQTLGAAGLSGEQGGFCGAAGAAGWLAGLAALGLVGRRRAALAALLALAAAPVDALADEGPKRADYELRVGSLALADAYGAYEAVYGEPGFLNLQFEGGRRLLRVVETDLTIGLTRKRGYLVGVDSGESSGEAGRLTLLPVGASVSLHGELFEGQPLVPFVRAGTEYWLFMEQYDYGAGYLEGTLNGDLVSGGRGTWSYGYGVSLLLDWIDARGASEAEARWGIRDTYLVAELREHAMFEEPAEAEGFSFTGQVFSLGLKMDL